MIGIGVKRIVINGIPATSPASFFSAGAWFDPSDLSTLFQDSAGTTPVTAVGQPVGLMLDKSGNGHHATQSTATARPILQQDEFGKYYLLFDGIDDFLVTGNIDFTGTDKMTVWAGLHKNSDAAGGMVVELSYSMFVSNGAVLISAPPAPGISYRFASKGTEVRVADTFAYPAPVTSVVTGIGDIAGDISRLRVNGSFAAQNTGDQGTGNYGNYPLYIGARGGMFSFLNGRIYSLIVRGAASSEAEIASIEDWVNGKTGAY